MVPGQCFPSGKGLSVFVHLRSVLLGFVGFLISLVVGWKGSLEISPFAETEKHPLPILKC